MIKSLQSARHLRGRGTGGVGVSCQCPSAHIYICRVIWHDMFSCNTFTFGCTLFWWWSLWVFNYDPQTTVPAGPNRSFRSGWIDWEDSLWFSKWEVGDRLITRHLKTKGDYRNFKYSNSISASIRDMTLKIFSNHILADQDAVSIIANSHLSADTVLVCTANKPHEAKLQATHHFHCSWWLGKFHV